ncbi:MAG: hypothetical protein K9G49_13870 [Taibaiella sp.]|nr:hypothetical protein [Taibaiella sp.]
MRNAIALFFLLIFSMQALPVRALGRQWSKGLQTEEVKNDCNDADDDSLEEKEDNYNNIVHSYVYLLSVSSAGSPKQLRIIHGKYNLPNDHIKDIYCPPPNSIFYLV